MSIGARQNPRHNHHLEVGAVHVWVVDLDGRPPTADLLSAREHARAERFLRDRERRRWSCARAVLRSLLGEYSRCDARALSFVTGAHGKPELEGMGGVYFNLAHSDNVAIYAIAAAQPVGVDVELVGRDIDVLAVAGRAFGWEARARLSALHPETREREFLREWVGYEARLKCLGTGLGGAGAGAQGRRPWVAELNLPSRWADIGAVAAVSAMAEPDEVCCWEWEG